MLWRSHFPLRRSFIWALTSPNYTRNCGDWLTLVPIGSLPLWLSPNDEIGGGMPLKCRMRTD